MKYLPNHPCEGYLAQYPEDDQSRPCTHFGFASWLVYGFGFHGQAAFMVRHFSAIGPAPRVNALRRHIEFAPYQLADLLAAFFVPEVSNCRRGRRYAAGSCRQV